ncbi:MAG: class I SAM-dependent methyltransferase [Chitinophagaceae bacterium]
MEEEKKYYEQHLAEHGFTPKGMGWRDGETQAKRFQQLATIIKGDNFKINDLGCGSGDFLSFLNAKIDNPFTYTGYDKLQQMIEHAAARFNTIGYARFFHISDPLEMQMADYSIASGIFNLKYSSGEEEWLDQIVATIRAMNERSGKGMAFNLLTKYSDKEFMQDYLYYADPLFFFDYCKKNFSRNVALLHDYDEYDFTILVRK